MTLLEHLKGALEALDLLSIPRIEITSSLDVRLRRITARLQASVILAIDRLQHMEQTQWYGKGISSIMTIHV
jgi:hypothetical protein